MQRDIESITNALKNHLDEHAVLSIVDESVQHRGHRRSDLEVGVTHIALKIVWKAFEGLTLIERHRLVNTWLDSFFKNGLHAVQYDLKTPNEEVIS